jgi:hypothetical protein
MFVAIRNAASSCIVQLSRQEYDRGMKKFAIATMIITLLTVPAYSQQGITARTDKEKKEDAATEKAYEDTLKRVKSNGPAVKSDPWQTVRPAGGDSTKH